MLEGIIERMEHMYNHITVLPLMAILITIILIRATTTHTLGE